MKLFSYMRLAACVALAVVASFTAQAHGAALVPGSVLIPGAAPEIFDHDHQKILEHLDLIEAAISDIKRAELSDEELRVRCLHQLDREKIFVDLCEHHDRRERLYLYPRLEQVLGDSAKADLLERMVGPGSLPEVRL